MDLPAHVRRLTFGESVSGNLEPQNLVWVRHQDDDLVTEMDGYELFSHSIPTDAADKVHQSRSGQLWVTPAGWSVSIPPQPMDSLPGAPHSGGLPTNHTPPSKSG